MSMGGGGGGGLFECQNLCVQLYRKCFFMSQNPHQLKQDFMKSVNRSVKGGGFFTCSFRDNDFGAFLLYKKRLCASSQLKLKKAVSCCGLQVDENHNILPESPWILGPKVMFNKKGELLEIDTSDYVWLSNIDCHFAGLSGSQALPIFFPLGSSGLVDLISALSTTMQHNFHPALLTLGAAVMVLHYAQLVRKRGHCHVPILYGRSQTGKTTALQCALAMFGCHRHSFYSRGSKEAYLLKCSSSTLPIGCDDPPSPSTIGQLIVELFNGAKCTLVKYGDKTPTSSAIISANFNLCETAK